MIVKYFVTSGLGNTLFQIKAFHEDVDTNSKLISTFLYKKNIFTSLLGWSFHDSFVKLNKLPVVKETFFDFFALFIIFLRKKIDSSRNYYDFRLVGTIWRFGYFQNVLLTEKDKCYVTDYLDFELSGPQIECTCHVRWGDFPLEERLSIDYYVTAISRAIELGCRNINIIGPGSPELFMFIPHYLKSYCQLTGESEESDFRALWNSNVVIASNSTFCLWASLFGRSEILIYNSDVRRTFKFNVQKCIYWI